MPDLIDSSSIDFDGSTTVATRSPSSPALVDSGAVDPPAQVGLPEVRSGSVASLALTEFTKRRNWPAKIVDELTSLLHILDANGRIKYLSPNITALTQHTTDELQDVFLKDLIHPDDVGVFIADLNECIASGSVLRLFYRLRRKDSTYVILQAIGHAHIAPAKFAPLPLNQAPFCQAIFLTAVQYPSKNIGLVDSFLEHKMENVWLRKRISTLREEEDRIEKAKQARTEKAELLENGLEAVSDDAEDSLLFPHDADDHPSQFKRLQTQQIVADQLEQRLCLGHNMPLVRAKLEDSADGFSLIDQMNQYGIDVYHVDPIEMFTGLRYQEGERICGIVTGQGDKKKKPKKLTEDNVCTDCGTLKSPEWRKGPGGPKTLCNACGLRWAKREKKLNSEATPTPAQLAQMTPITPLAQPAQEGSWATTSM